MTKDQARIVVLEDALEQAQNLVGFLHGCLTDPKFKYAHPEMTLWDLEKWDKLVPVPDYCVHSRNNPDCASCQRHIEKYTQLAEARKVLDGTQNEPTREERFEQGITNHKSHSIKYGRYHNECVFCHAIDRQLREKFCPAKSRTQERDSKRGTLKLGCTCDADPGDNPYCFIHGGD